MEEHETTTSGRVRAVVQHSTVSHSLEGLQDDKLCGYEAHWHQSMGGIVLSIMLRGLPWHQVKQDDFENRQCKSEMLSNGAVVHCVAEWWYQSSSILESDESKPVAIFKRISQNNHAKTWLGKTDGSNDWQHQASRSKHVA
eukprot:1874840-Amphidinium_carterae.1